jgi:hypothetical protein
LHGFLNHEVAGGRALEEVVANLLVDARSAHGVTEIKVFLKIFERLQKCFVVRSVAKGYYNIQVIP